ncbi:MAG: N-acetyl-gamma-glutamyl-phosphate reductase [Verrucomicrobiota bacterium]|nr:N-acetyl-gamma-glutamyl-phosphate reductase [Opitutae bacterium]MEC7401762.1 N-acetyl-gamma-glutamyl-phosphate reductase [Verrucomicrobiota bacterium]MEC8655388.1 N-acetyl-gamma-glutamyl-phosphate reductase [Verrucomicrobiota bacterium]HAY75864.1 N-acetyl-gamma-glutamyl-phosphate reductase [Opitutae bacterium]|tara:strand:+ start:4478 stop:5506 length:1029 start_codon:yes stop_codon:yes gene_type:complete
MNVCIIGASGYSGRELVSLLLDHPYAKLTTITSRSLDGQKLEDCLPKLRGKDRGLRFSNPSREQLCQDSSLEVFFLALPHGTAASYAIPLLEAGKKVIDLSADFRLRSPVSYKEYYGEEHPAPSWLKQAQYGLPELHDLSWEKSPLIASPGCYPTSILVPLAPLLKSKLIQKEGIVANCISGISGAGRTASERLLFCERNENSSAYGLPKHRHLSEIEEQLSLFAEENVVLSFQPHLAPMNRGICSTLSVLSEGPVRTEKIYDCWKNAYSNRPFVQILASGTFPETSAVTGTNRIDFSGLADPRTNRYVLCSTEDNLIKGAGGQAIQAMNLCQGYPEESGLS